MLLAGLLLVSLIGTIAGATDASATAPTWIATTWLETGASSAQHPSSWGISCDGNVVVMGVHWQNWGANEADGHGTIAIAGPCNPSCSTAPSYRYPVRVVASQIALCGSAGHTRQIYGRITEYLSRPDIRGDRQFTQTLQSCVQPQVVLGSSVFAQPYGEGWGSSRPSLISNGGDPSGHVWHIHWSSWGGPAAFGTGLTAIFKPGGGYYNQLVRIQLKATDVGRCTANGPLAYQQLWVREPSRPGGPLASWFPWAGGASATLCK